MACDNARRIEFARCELGRNGARKEHERLHPCRQKPAVRSEVIGVCHCRQTRARQQRLMRSAKVGVGEAVKDGEHGRLCGLTLELSGAL
jgi:hypothetical protein